MEMKNQSSELPLVDRRNNGTARAHLFEADSAGTKQIEKQRGIHFIYSSNHITKN